MIVVGPLWASRAPWRGGMSCHMTSDTSAEELKSFAASIGLSSRWLRLGIWKTASIGPTEGSGWFSTGNAWYFFELSPRWRARVIAAGAVDVDTAGYDDAVRRFRARQSGSGIC